MWCCFTTTIALKSCWRGHLSKRTLNVSKQLEGTSVRRLGGFCALVSRNSDPDAPSKLVFDGVCLSFFGVGRGLSEITKIRKTSIYILYYIVIFSWGMTGFWWFWFLVVFVLGESFSGQLISAFGGEPGFQRSYTRCPLGVEQTQILELCGVMIVMEYSSLMLFPRAPNTKPKKVLWGVFRG